MDFNSFRQNIYRISLRIYMHFILNLKLFITQFIRKCIEQLVNVIMCVKQNGHVSDNEQFSN